MSKYTLADLQSAILVASGGKGGERIAAAVSLAENPGMRTETNSPPNKDGSIDRGPFQLNNKAHPEVSDQCAHDLVCSANAAYKISNGFSDWSPWTTCGRTKNCTSGPAATIAKSSRLGKFNENTSGSGVLGTGIGPDVAPGASESAAGLVDGWKNAVVAIAKAVATLFRASTWLRIGKVVGGLILLILAAMTLLRKDISNVAEIAKVVK